MFDGDVAALTGLIQRISTILEPIGFAFEPIATNSDPENDIDADYAIRLTFRVNRPGLDEKEGYFCAVFNAYVRLSKLAGCSQKEFMEMMKELLIEAHRFKERLESTDDEDVTIVDRSGTIPSLSEIIANAEQLLKATRH